MISNLRVAIVSIYPFPNGGAATNRILAYSKGLIASGAEVDIFVIIPTENFCHGELLPDSGIFQEINYYYTSGRYRNPSKIVRAISILSRFRQYYGYYTSYKLIKKYSFFRQYSSIIISTDLIPAITIYAYLSRNIFSKSIFIFDEFPTPIRHKLKTAIPFWKKIGYKLALKNIDAYVSISNELKNFYNKFAYKPTLVLPVIVDFTKFTLDKKTFTVARKYLCYMGNLELAKDDVDNIIRAYKLIIDDFPDIELDMYGNPDPQTRTKLMDLIYQLGLKGKVHLKGRVRSDLVPEIINNAHILVSSQPNTKRASGGFPTKLGEYLSTGIPTLLTNVGENAKYVQDREHVFFAKPSDPINYAECLRYIINNYEEALLIAKKGQEYVFNNYSHIVQGKILYDFILKL